MIFESVFPLLLNVAVSFSGVQAFSQSAKDEPETSQESNAPTETLGLPSLSAHVFWGQFDLAYKLEDREWEVTELSRLRTAVLRTAYEEVVIETCSPAEVGPLASITLRFDAVTKQYGREIDRDKGIPIEHKYRARFGDSYLQSLDLMMSPFYVLSTVGLTYRELFADMAGKARSTHQRLGCGTAEAQQFSENLHAIVLDQPSLQARGLVESAFLSQCSANLGDLSANADDACRCLEEKLVAFSPVGVVSQLENTFSRDRLVLTLAAAPDLFDEAKTCF